MPHSLDRRSFLKSASAGLGAGLVIPAVASAAPAVRAQPGAAADRVRVALMGVNSRGGQLARAFLNTPGAAITVICDVDSRAAARAIAAVSTLGGGTPRAIGDIRKVLESPDVDALVVAAPDHWHAPAAIMAMQAGKHVYVEKPLAHTIEQGAELVKAAGKSGKVVQVGTQNRSSTLYKKAKAMFQQGMLGDVHYVRAFWYRNSAPNNPAWRYVIPPEANEQNSDWEKFLGPAPKRSFRETRMPRMVRTIGRVSCALHLLLPVCDFADTAHHFDWASALT
jgi:hypothetical protein